MKVKTSNPIIIDKTKVSPSDYFSSATGGTTVDYDFLPEEIISSDDVRVTTKYPVILNGSDISPRDYYSNATGVPSLDPATLAAIEEAAKKTGSAPSAKDQAAAKEKGVFWDNAKKAWKAFADSDAGKVAISQIDAALTARREAKYGSGQGGAMLPSDQAALKSEPMSSTAKALLIGGGVIVAGLIIYSVVAKGK